MRLLSASTLLLFGAVVIPASDLIKTPSRFDMLHGKNVRVVLATVSKTDGNYNEIGEAGSHKGVFYWVTPNDFRYTGSEGEYYFHTCEAGNKPAPLTVGQEVVIIQNKGGEIVTLYIPGRPEIRMCHFR